MFSPRKIFLLVVALIVFSSFSSSAYADDCAALGGAIVGAECQISSVVKKTGSFTIDETLRILANKTINATNTTDVGISLAIDGDLILEQGAMVSANDELGSTTEPASPITLDISGNLEMNDKSAIFAENRRGSGKGGDIKITTDKNILMKSGSNISSSRRNTGNPSGSIDAGNIIINAKGSITLETNTVMAAVNDNLGPGNISIEADGIISIDGLISVGPSTKVLSSKYTGDILSGGDTLQKGGTITIISNSKDEPGITIGTNAILVSQGEDPGSDKILLEGCGIKVNGLIGSVAKKSHDNDSVAGIISLRSGTTIEINGQDLGDVGSAQARIRADDVSGEKPKPRRVDIFADGKITVNGALSGDIFTVTSNGGISSDQFGGAIRAISLKDAISSSAKALQAKATSIGSDGGKVNLSAKSVVDIDTSSIEAPGDFDPSGGLGLGGKIDARSYGDAVSWTIGVGDVRPTGDGVALASRGTVNLTACTTVDVTGTLFPSSGSPTVPGILTGACAPTAPSLPAGEPPLPDCEPDHEIPEFTTIGAALALAGAGLYIYRRRKR